MFSSLFNRVRNAFTHCVTIEEEDDVIEPVQPKKHKLVPTVQWHPEPLHYPNPLGEGQLNAMVYYYRRAQLPGNIVYDPLPGTVLEAGWHKLTFKFIALNSEIYQNLDYSIEFEVKKGIPQLVWSLPHVYIEYTTPLDEEYFQASCADTEGTFRYSHDVNSVPERGKHKLCVQFVPNDRRNYIPVSISRELFVAGLPVTLVWSGSLFSSEYPMPLNRFHLRARPADPTILGDFVYTPKIGTVLPVGKHMVRADFSPYDTRKYNVAHIYSEIEILKGFPTVKWWSPFSLYEGEVLDHRSLNATCEELPGGSFEYRPPAGTILPVGEHVLTTTYTPQDETSYHQMEEAVTIHVLKKSVTSIQWDPIPDMEYPARLTLRELNATVIPNERGKFIYEPPLGSNLEVGHHVLRVEFVPDSKRSVLPCEGTQSLVVVKTKPKLSWAAPRPLFLDDVKQGGLITEKELVCRSNIPDGVFEYQPSAGEVLPLGKHSLSVKFFPADAVTYDPSELTVPVKVVKPPKRKPVLIWTPLEPIFYPKPLRTKEELVCKCSESHGSLIFAPPNGTVLPVGEHVLSVSFVPFRNNLLVEEGSITTTIVVKKAPSFMSWVPESRVLTYGTPLSTGMLNATYWIVAENCEEIRKVAGTFEYDPPLGTILDANFHTLHCKFIPKDAENVQGCEISIDIEVLRAKPKLIWSNPSEEDPIQLSEPLNELYFSPIVLPVTEFVPIPQGSFKFSHKVGDKLPVGVHEVKSRFYPEDIINYYSSDVTCFVHVVRGFPEVAWASTDQQFNIVYGTPITLKEHLAANCITPDCSGHWEYSPLPGTILNVGNDIEIKATFFPDSTDIYQEIALQRVVNVKPFGVPLDWQAPNHLLTYGDILTSKELNAVVNIRGLDANFHLTNIIGGHIQYTPAEGTKLLAGRKMIITAEFVPPISCAQNYRGIKMKVFIDVNKADPVITWRHFALPLAFNTPLPPEFLNATSNIPGKFVYSPGPGTILEVGKTKIDCKFHPDDTRNYNDALISRDLKIVKGTPKIRWDVPMSVEVGQPLTRNELNAYLVYPKNITGGFQYSMSLGTAFTTAGLIPVHVTFLPSGHDALNWNKSKVYDTNIDVIPKGKGSAMAAIMNKLKGSAPVGKVVPT